MSAITAIVFYKTYLLYLNTLASKFSTITLIYEAETLAQAYERQALAPETRVMG